MSKFSIRLVLVALALTMLMVSGSYAAIGVYKWTAAVQSVPAGISYMLNTDANDISSGWSVKIEIVPAAGGAAVRTWTFLSPDPLTAKGMHTNAVTWDGYKNDGTAAPTGDYKAVITAKAAPVTGTDVIPIWESGITTTAFRDAGVNKNPNSPYYGYVYAVNASTKAVYMFEPDGSAYTTFAAKSANNWNGSAPWGVDIAADDSAWVTSYTGSWLSQFTPTGTTRLYEGQPMGSAYRNPRFFSVQGPSAPGANYTGSGFSVVESYCTGYPAVGKLFVWSGNEPPGTFNPEIVLDFCPQEPKFLSNGDIAVPAYADINGATTGGFLARYSLAGTKISSNSNIRRGVGLAITSDEQYVYVSRFVDTTNASYNDADTTPIYKINAATAFTTAAPGTADVVSLGLQCAGDSKKAYTLECDKVGNLVAATGVTNPITLWNATHVGLYAVPDNGSTDTRTTAVIHWSGESAPAIVSTNSGVEVPVCDGGGTIQVVASDNDGYNDVQRVYLDLSQFGQGVLTPMNRVSYSGTQSTWELHINVPSTTPVGEYTIPFVVRDVHYPAVEEVAGTTKIIALGGWITGNVTVDKAGWGVAGATVSATDGVNTFTATSDADGNYAINANPGTYTVSAAKGTGYTQIADTTAVTVVCAQTTANINRKLGPTDVRTCTGGNYYQFPGRLMGDMVCVTGTVYRAPAIAGVQPGFDGYYYIYDTEFNGTLQAVRILNYAGQANLKEGDKVTVEGTWSFIGGGSGYFQGYVNPAHAPYFVSANNPLPSPTAFTMIERNNSYGRYYSVSGKVLEVGTDRFKMDAPSGGSSVAPEIWIVMRSLASTGVTLPAVNDFVEVKGVLSHIDSFAQNVLCPGKPSDVAPWPLVTSLGAARSKPDGGIIIDCTANPLVVTHAESSVQPGSLTQTWFYVESPDRSAGLKVSLGSLDMTPNVIWPGDTVAQLRGRLARTNDDRVLTVSELPVVTVGAESNIPKPVAMTNVTTGGGWFGGNAPVSDKGNGLNNQGLLATVYGRVTAVVTHPEYGYVTDVFIDDGSGVVGAINGTPPATYVGLKCKVDITPVGYATQPTMNIGDYVVATGIIGSEWVKDSTVAGGGYRIRILRMRYDADIFGTRSYTPLEDVFRVIPQL